ncbi:putative plastid-lipid-associated protein 12 chloroplastic-like [Heracleum sosnowskyi]|uniref:Plastid-lipid-associated protein 12 chloroplastic-like n=1 Tax=Heracleum sosnowskyi TaxID=360622 RepID=A0AAD8J6W3_9APIA|nr:putative plastid-lipid-associated protein 12 chloroplastic-like [Heracleum sosnowskyi]
MSQEYDWAGNGEDSDDDVEYVNLALMANNHEQEASSSSNQLRLHNLELGVEAAASVKDGKRILFRFDKAAFSFKFLPFKVPYPVPFKLLGDEAKGWLDTTYLSNSGNLRISKGNKGTTFVLQKTSEPRQRLLSAISTDTKVRKEIEDFLAMNRNAAKGEQQLLEGEWNMIWSSQIILDVPTFRRQKIIRGT